ncbi:PGF-pre-PGF domain-containing protein [Methanosarcina sp. T3]|uniref:PGF-pre-PGF domain-containing protein n=1 Tax=Methanosarcina sp. T3 TaxID=3439062 RepID=UPI003F86F257
MLTEDDKYLYFTAETPGFSPFAITDKLAAEETVIEILPEPQVPEQNESIESEITKSS